MTVNNLYVTYDEDGTSHFHVNDEEVTEQEWKLRHPNFKEGNANGGNRNSGRVGRLGGDGTVTADESDAKGQRRQGVRDHRARVRQAEGEESDHVEGEET